jgi:hypothetical protein
LTDEETKLSYQSSEPESGEQGHSRLGLPTTHPAQSSVCPHCGKTQQGRAVSQAFSSFEEPDTGSPLRKSSSLKRMHSHQTKSNPVNVPINRKCTRLNISWATYFQSWAPESIGEHRLSHLWGLVWLEEEFGPLIKTPTVTAL